MKSVLSFAAPSRLHLIKITHCVELCADIYLQDLLRHCSLIFPICVRALKSSKISQYIDENVLQVPEPFRRLPFALRSKVAEKTNQPFALDIVQEAPGPTLWISPAVIVPKPETPEDIRLYIGMRCANRAIHREPVCPTIDDSIAALNGAKTFNKTEVKRQIPSTRA